MTTGQIEARKSQLLASSTPLHDELRCLQNGTGLGRRNMSSNLRREVDDVSTQNIRVVAAPDSIAAIRWTPNPLVPQQRAAAAAAPGPVFIDGGPGTGRTHTLRARVAALVVAGADPNCIVVLTKSSLAAEEFAVMLAEMPEMDGRVAGIFFGTFHAYAGSFVRQVGAQVLGINPDYALWGPDQCLLALEQLAGDHREATGAPISRRNVHRMWEWHSRNRTRTDLPPIPPVDGVWRELRDEYTAAKRQQHALDGADLLEVFVETLRNHPGVRDVWRQRYVQHLLIDDFQDVTPVQYELVRLLAGPEESVAVAVDRNSAVLSSRGGDAWVVEQFLTHYGNAGRHELPINHRATETLSAAAKTLQDSPAMPGVRAMAQTSFRKRGDPPSLVVNRGPISALDQRVVRKVMEHYNEEGYDWNDMAFLYADARTARRLAARLRAQGIPSRDLGKPAPAGAADRFAVQNLLVLALNGRDAVAMHNALAAGLSTSQQKNIAKTMRALRQIAAQRDGDLLGAAHAYVQSRRRSTLVTRRMEFIMETVPVLQAAMAQNGAHMEGVIRLADTEFRENGMSNPHPQPSADLRRFFDIADRMANAATPLKAQFLRLFDLLADASDPFQRSSGIGDPNGNGRAVTLCPVRLAQGFQWRVVFLLDCVEEHMPGHAANGDDDVLHEAQRLFYVAVTRPRDRLHICCPLVDDNWARRPPSRFIAALESALDDFEAS